MSGEKTKNKHVSTTHDVSQDFNDDNSIVVTIDSEPQSQIYDTKYSRFINEEPDNDVEYFEDEDKYEEERRPFLKASSSCSSYSSVHQPITAPLPPTLKSVPSATLSHCSSAATIITRAYNHSFYGSIMTKSRHPSITKTPRVANRKVINMEENNERNDFLYPSLPLSWREDCNYECFSDTENDKKCEENEDDSVGCSSSVDNSSLVSTKSTTVTATVSTVLTKKTRTFAEAMASFKTATKTKTHEMWKKMRTMVRNASFHVRNSDDDNSSKKTSKNGGWKDFDLPYEFTLLECLAALTLYLLIGLVSYSFLFEHWSVVDALYFTVVTFTTIGYGDLTPHTIYGRMFTSLFAFLGIAILGVVLGVVGSRLVEAQVMAFEKAEREMSRQVVSLFTARRKRKRSKKKKKRRDLLQDLLFSLDKLENKENKKAEDDKLEEQDKNQPIAADEKVVSSMASNTFYFENGNNTSPLFETESLSTDTNWSDDMTTETTSSNGSFRSYSTFGDDDDDDDTSSIVTDVGDDYMVDDNNGDGGNSDGTREDSSRHDHRTNENNNLLEGNESKKNKSLEGPRQKTNNWKSSLLLWQWSVSLLQWIRHYLPAIIPLVLGSFMIGWYEGWSWLDTLYYFVTTTTTVGYGDWVPTRKESKWFGVLFIPLAVGAMGHLLGTIANFIIEQRRKAYQKQLWTKQQNLTLHDLNEMGSNQNGEVTLLEYVEFMLTTMKKVDSSLLEELHSQFHELDLTKSGTICKKDLRLMAKRRMRRVRNKLMLSAYKYKLTHPIDKTHPERHRVHPKRWFA